MIATTWRATMIVVAGIILVTVAALLAAYAEFVLEVYDFMGRAGW